MDDQTPLSKAEAEALYRRVAVLEETVKGLTTVDAAKPDPWWRREIGRFANDPVWEEILRRGREYRESTRDPEESAE